MTTYYVGPGGNDGNAGTSWAARKATLTGAEDIPVVANDTVYVGPGTYRETLTLDVSGSSGQPITYIGDVTGANTDGVGGLVRITGSDNDQTGTRDYCVTDNGRSYRTFRGFAFEGALESQFHVTGGGANVIIEDCQFFCGGAYDTRDVYVSESTPTNITIRRCLFWGYGQGVYFYSGSDTAASGCTVTNCLFTGKYYGLVCNNVSGVSMSHCTVVGAAYSVYVNSLAASSSITLRNSQFLGCHYNLYSSAAGQIDEDYNNVTGSYTDRTNVTAGANSVAYIPGLWAAPLFDGVRLPAVVPGDLAPWSALRGFVGSATQTDDLYGVTRPTTASKQSLGAVQYQPVVREASTTYDSSAASLELSDAGEVQFRAPVTATSTTISVRAYREANYAGTNPQMIIMQAGQSDRTTTDTGSAGAWNQLTDTFTPAATPDYVVVVLRSNNTATSGSYAAYFDALAVS
jgi:hypothetical protein